MLLKSVGNNRTERDQVLYVVDSITGTESCPPLCFVKLGKVVNQDSAVVHCDQNP